MNEIDLMGLIDVIFSDPVQLEKYYSIQFDTDNNKQLFESLLMIFTYATKRLFGDTNGTVDLKSLGKDNMALLENYFKSFGIVLITNVYNELQYSLSNIRTYKEINIDKNTKLDELVFSIKCVDDIYTISFNLL